MTEFDMSITDILKPWKESFRRALYEHNFSDAELTSDTSQIQHGFDWIYDMFIAHEPIRNTDWAKGMYAVLDEDNIHITMHYEDKDPTLDHCNKIEGFSASDLASDKWIPIMATRRSLEEEFGERN